ncbi:glycosyltransferase [Enterococcus sp. AZ135]|uniref:glycosyltransferase n=2 Tax=Enterococcus TaxID=1350 RepID=UPI003F683F35
MVLLALNLFSTSKLRRVSSSNFDFKRPNPTNFKIYLFATFILVGITYYQFISFDTNRLMWVYPVVILSFFWNNFLLISSFQYKPFSLDEMNDPKKLKTAVVIPVYNEDRVMFSKMLKSLSDQTMTPTVVYIVEDGSKEEHLVEEIVSQWKKEVPFEVIYKYIANSGKRVAQSHAFRDYQDIVDIFLTMDSDTVLDENAIYEGCIPFQDSEIMSVAGLLLAENKTTFISKILSLSFPISFTNGRASASVYNSVSVSCGGLALYRNTVIKQFLDEYLNQIVFKQRAMFGDDRMLTHYASLLGKTVYQETSIGYTLMPENISHLTRQRVRWWKSFWWGGMYIIRHHSFKYMIWWLIAMQYVTQLMYFIVFPFVLFIYPIQTGIFPWPILLYMVVLGYLRGSRLLGIQDSSGEKYLSFIKYVLYTPISTVFNIYLGTMLAYYGFFMMVKVQGWGTRENVEVGINRE